jgi:hypothetical protein
MWKFFHGLISAFGRVVLVAGILSVAVASGLAADTNAASIETFDYASPSLFTGTIYEIGSMRSNVLFTFRRTATRSGSTVNVERRFISPDGTLAAVENVVYESGRLVSFQMRDFTARVSGSIWMEPDPRDPAREKILIGYGNGLNPPMGSPQNLQPDTLVDDTMYPFIMVHWDELMRGQAVKFHFAALEWKRTFLFRMVKSGESICNGKPVVQIKMEPDNPIVAAIINPLVLTVETAPPHHVLSYLGRIVPRVKKGRGWKYLDAETVFDWK